ncbi:MAG: LptF/LptG family permease [Armatimonas sp.]
MTRMDRLVLNEIVGLFIGGVMLFTTLFFATGELIRYVEFLQTGRGWGLVIQLILTTIPMALSFTTAMGMLLACLLGFGRLSDDNEVTALTAAGVPFTRIALPGLIFAALVSLGLSIAAHTVVPSTMRTRQALLDDAKKDLGGGPQIREAFFLPLKTEGKLVLLNALGGVGTNDSGVATLDDVFITVTENDKVISMVQAKQAHWRVDRRDWKMEGIKRLVYWKNNILVEQSGGSLETKEVTYKLKSPEELSVFARSVMEHTTAELLQRAAILRETGQKKEAAKADGEIARRQVGALAPFIFALVGAPLGVRPKRSGAGMGYALSVLITFVYWVLSQVCLSLAIGSGGPIGILAQIPNILGIGLGIFFLGRVVRYNRV